MINQEFGFMPTATLDRRATKLEDPILLWEPRDSTCGLRLTSFDPRLPIALESIVDGHIQPDQTRHAAVRTHCAHVTGELHHLWRRLSTLDCAEPVFVAPVGFPSLPALFAAHEQLAAMPGRAGLALDLVIATDPRYATAKVHLHAISVEDGSLSEQEWNLLAPVLTSCSAFIAIGPDAGIAVPLPSQMVSPAGWIRGAAGCTRWTYSVVRRPRCQCPGCAQRLPLAARGLVVMP